MRRRPKYIIPTPEEMDAWLLKALQPYRHPPEVIERIKRTKREAKERKKMLADMLNGRPWATRDKGVTDEILAAFDGGEWLTIVDVIGRTGQKSGNVKGTVARLVGWGCLEKRERAAYDKTVPFYHHRGGDCRFEYRQKPGAWPIRESRRIVRRQGGGKVLAAERARLLREREG